MRHWLHWWLGSALGITAVEPSLPATFLYQRKYRVDRWCCDLDEAAHFLDGGDECIDLQGSASLKILQHRNFVADDRTGCVQPPLHHVRRDRNTERFRDSPCLSHHGLAQGAEAGLGGDAIQRRQGKGADRIETDVAPELEPDIPADRV